MQGRWLSPDPFMGSMDLSNPQSLNRYAYVRNGPMNATDPDGLDVIIDLPPFDGGGGDPCFDDPLGCFIFPPIPIPIFVGGGGGGGGRGGGAPAPEPNVNPSGKPPLSGETLGLPNGMSIQQRGLLAALDVPLPPVCDFGACVPDLGIGFAGDGPQGQSSFINWGYLEVLTKTFADGFLNGIRKPGETFGHCVNNNISTTTFGSVDPDKLLTANMGKLHGLAIVMATYPASTLRGAHVSLGTRFLQLATGAVGLTGTARALTVRGGMLATRATAVAGAATTGLVVGSMFNCAAPH